LVAAITWKTSASKTTAITTFTSCAACATGSRIRSTSIARVSHIASIASCNRLIVACTATTIAT
jgi:hypothetical protein